MVCRDIVFVDPGIPGLILDLALPFLFGLINQEIGAKPSDSHRGAILCLVLVSFYWLLKDFSHRQALTDLSQITYNTGATLRVGAVPKLVDPFGWNGIVETETPITKTESAGIVVQRLSIREKGHSQTRAERRYRIG